MELYKLVHKYVHGEHDARTDNQEKADMATDIHQYAIEYHERQLKLLNLASVSVSKCTNCGGTGFIQNDNYKDDCSKCYGEGFIND